jgi:hypothetical protein
MSQSLPPPAPAPSGISWPRVLLRDAPYLLMLAMAIVGIAYAGFGDRNFVVYWEILAPVYGAICIIAGWRHLPTRQQRIDLVWTQALHWAAVLLAMFLMFLPEVRGVVNTNANGLSVIILLALGTFVAGVHARSWRICLVGALLGVAVPAIAWIEQSILLILLGVALLAGVVLVFWWATRRELRRAG